MKKSSIILIIIISTFFSHPWDSICYAIDVLRSYNLLSEIDVEDTKQTDDSLFFQAYNYLQVRRKQINELVPTQKDEYKTLTYYDLCSCLEKKCDTSLVDSIAIEWHDRFDDAISKFKSKVDRYRHYITVYTTNSDSIFKFRHLYMKRFYARPGDDPSTVDLYYIYKYFNIPKYLTTTILADKDDYERLMMIAFKKNICVDYLDLDLYFVYKCNPLLAEFLYTINTKFESEIAYNKNLQKKAQAEEQYINKLVRKYGKKYGYLVAKKEVQVGMTTDMCKEAWGTPENVNTTITAKTKYEQWVYSNNRYLYFENGILSTIQY